MVLFLVYFDLPEALETDFRNEIFQRFGMKHGNLTKAICEAIRLWIDTPPNKETES